MYVRLAFAVAAHLEPEILVVDEVLAVGDADFQLKCIGAMERVGQSGRTVLVVSHNLATVDSLCKRSLWLDRGRVHSCGPTTEVIREFLSSLGKQGHTERLGADGRNGDTGGRFLAVGLLDSQGRPCTNLKVGDPLSVELHVLAERPIARPWVGVEVRTTLNQLVSHMANRECGDELPPLVGECRVTCDVETVNLLPGRYFIDLILADVNNTRYDHVTRAAHFDVHPTDVSGAGVPLTSRHGLVFFKSRWRGYPAIGGHNGAAVAGEHPLARSS
jgi:hypothetical protein